MGEKQEMAVETKTIQIDRSTDIVALAEEVRKTGEDRILEKEGKALARLTPIEAEKERRNAFSPNDSLWNIVGMDTSQGNSDTSTNKYKYISNAIEEHFH